MVLVPIRPTFFRSPRLATPRNSEAKTSGMMTILISRMKGRSDRPDGGHVRSEREAGHRPEKQPGHDLGRDARFPESGKAQDDDGCGDQQSLGDLRPGRCSYGRPRARVIPQRITAAASPASRRPRS